MPGPCTWINRNIEGGTVTAPMSGVIVRWRVKGSAMSGATSVSFRVVRPGAGGKYVGAGTSPGTIGTTPGVYTNGARLPIQAGDTIGGACAANGGSLTCPVGTLASGASSTSTLVARLKAGKQTNTASISSALAGQAAAHGALDGNPLNNLATVTVTVSSPAVSSASVSPKAFRPGSLLPKLSRRTPVGTTIRFKLSEPAKTTLTFSQPRTGRRVGRRCVPPTRRNRHRRRCTIPNVRGTLSFNGHGGSNRVRFQGRLTRTRKLKPGRYLLTITATDSAGNRSGAKSTSFTILRG